MKQTEQLIHHHHLFLFTLHIVFPENQVKIYIFTLAYSNDTL